MKLVPILNRDGQLLGHIDLNRCWRHRDNYIVDEHAGEVSAVWHHVTGTDADAVKFYRFPIKRIRFRWGAHDQSTVEYVVVDDPIPEWVWVAAGIKFKGDEDWERQ